MKLDTINKTPTLVPTPSPLEAVQTELYSLLNRPATQLKDALRLLCLDGASPYFSYPVSALPVFSTNSTAGFNYSFETKMLAYVRFGFTTSQYWVVQSLMLDGVSTWVSHYYSLNGKHAFSEGPSTHAFAAIPNKNLEPKCPILNVLYNLAAVEYPKTATGDANTKLLHSIENHVRSVYKLRKDEMSFSKKSQDPAILELNQKLLNLEMDPVYSWKERQALFASIKGERHELISVKKRVHAGGYFQYSLPLWWNDVKLASVRFKKRPINNTLGILDRVLVSPIRWFGKVVRGNMGYSVALAIYSPFTFFFITQPMNPHAMWAVGKVRNAYIETTESIKGAFESIAGITATQTAAQVEKPQANALANLKPGSFGLLLSGEVPSVSNQSWDDRMSNFKAMQIAYEGNMEAAPRIGRLEQMETQLNWPLIVESTWIETERYSNFLSFLENTSKDYTPEFNQYVKAEKARTDQVQLYLWERNVRFILDHPFTMMDQSKEQTQMDYYVGRSFVMLKDMTDSLAARHQGLPMPAGFDGIMKLSQHFKQNYKKEGSVLERLKTNSKLFAQKDSNDTNELRSYMKRQWEVLYLLQNKTQEASNFGLQLYVWSVRNAVYTLQSLYSSKREELSMLSLNFKKGNVANKLSNNSTFNLIDSQYEALFHMMVLEYTSIRKEIGEALKNDIEANQRKQIIDGVESFLKERDALLKSANLI